MSYILDALRKADAQRQRERPGLSAQPVLASSDRDPGPWYRRPVAWVLTLVLLVAAAAVAVWPPAPQPAPQAAAPAVVITPSPPPVNPAPSPTPVAAAKIDPPPPPIPAPVAAPPRAAVVRPQVAPEAPSPVARAAPASAPASVPVVNKGTVEGPLPPDAPKLAITGGVYSQDPAQRMLIVGGQVFNEGSQVAPGVVLEQVRPHQAVLGFGGQRYTVGY